MQQKARLCVQCLCGKRSYWHEAEVKRKLGGALVSVGAVAGFKVGKSACPISGAIKSSPRNQAIKSSWVVAARVKCTVLTQQWERRERPWGMG
jgi:hypothetical protein